MHTYPLLDFDRKTHNRAITILKDGVTARVGPVFHVRCSKVTTSDDIFAHAPYLGLVAEMNSHHKFIVKSIMFLWRPVRGSTLLALFNPFGQLTTQLWDSADGRLSYSNSQSRKLLIFRHVASLPAVESKVIFQNSDPLFSQRVGFVYGCRETCRQRGATRSQFKDTAGTRTDGGTSGGSCFYLLTCQLNISVHV